MFSQSLDKVDAPGAEFFTVNREKRFPWAKVSQESSNRSSVARSSIQGAVLTRTSVHPVSACNRRTCFRVHALTVLLRDGGGSRRWH